MSTTVTDICNLALAKVGADSIQDITQNTRAAIKLNSIYEPIRDSVLREHPWNFAIKRVKLYPTSTTPAFEYDHEYDLPNDCLRILTIDEQELDEIEFSIEGRKLLSDEDYLDVRYIYRNEDPSEYDATFCNALAWRLASEIAYFLTQSDTREASCLARYKEVVKDARAMDGMEGTLKVFNTPSWKETRR